MIRTSVRNDLGMVETSLGREEGIYNVLRSFPALFSMILQKKEMSDEMER